MTRSARNTSLETRTARTRLVIRRTPYFAKIAKGLRLGYYRGAVAGSWIAGHYRGNGVYATEAIGAADDTLEADGINVFDYWQAQDHASRWVDRQRQIAEGRLREGPYTVSDAVKDYLGEIAAEKSPAAVQGAKYVFDAWILQELGSIQIEKLTTDRLNRWRNKIATQPKRVRSKRIASKPATRETADDDDARRARKATANRILTILKAALNRAFHGDRVTSDSAWRKVKPFKRVDEASYATLPLPNADNWSTHAHMTSRNLFRRRCSRAAVTPSLPVSNAKVSTAIAVRSRSALAKVRFATSFLLTRVKTAFRFGLPTAPELIGSFCVTTENRGVLRIRNAP